MEHFFEELPESEPLWAQLKKHHEIRVHYDPKTNSVVAMANGFDPEQAHDERSAVVALIQNNLLDGWQTVSISEPRQNFYD